MTAPAPRPPTLLAARLELRPYRPTDRTAFVALNADPEVRAHMDGPVSEAAGHARFDAIEAGALGWRGRCWAVTRAADGAYLGHTFLQPSEIEGQVEIGILLQQEFWGHGFAPEALQAVLHHAIHEAGLDRVIATIDEDHPASIRAVSKAGMVPDGFGTDEDGRYLIFSTAPTGQGAKSR